MSSLNPPDRGRGASVGTLLVALVLLVSPLREVWARPEAPWWTPAALWALIVLLAAWSATRPGRRA